MKFDELRHRLRGQLMGTPKMKSSLFSTRASVPDTIIMVTVIVHGVHKSGT